MREIIKGKDTILYPYTKFRKSRIISPHYDIILEDCNCLLCRLLLHFREHTKAVYETK